MVHCVYLFKGYQKDNKSIKLATLLKCGLTITSAQQ